MPVPPALIRRTARLTHEIMVPDPASPMIILLVKDGRLLPYQVI